MRTNWGKRSHVWRTQNARLDQMLFLVSTGSSPMTTCYEMASLVSFQTKTLDLYENAWPQMSMFLNLGFSKGYWLKFILVLKNDFPNIKMKPRFFKRYKPFTFFSPKQQDHVSCCWRVHVETRMVFKACMEFRWKLSSPITLFMSAFLKYIAKQTLCPKNEDR